MSKKADFIWARREEEAERITPTPRISTYPVATIKLKPTALPKFTGNKRDFHRRRTGKCSRSRVSLLAPKKSRRFSC